MAEGYYPRILKKVKSWPLEYKFSVYLKPMINIETDSDWLEGLLQIDSDSSGLSALPGIGLVSKSGEKHICVKFNETDSCEDNNLVSSEPLDLTHKHTVLLKQVKEEGSDNVKIFVIIITSICNFKLNFLVHLFCIS